MWNNKMKAVTFSFDDGILQDIRLVEILNKYGLKATFNLNSGMMNGELWQTGGVDVIRLTHRQCLETFKGHEAAVHSLTHPDLVTEPPIMQQRQIAGDKANLEFLFGEEIHGMAYPGCMGTDDRLVETVKAAGLKYARVIDESGSFGLPKDPYRLKGTIKFTREEMYSLADEFVNMTPSEPALFYIWGHSYELDTNKFWDQFEVFCSYISGREDIFYGTNWECLKEIL